MGVYGVARLGSMHNTYNVPSEPERATKARRAVVASVYKSSFFNIVFGLEVNFSNFYLLSNSKIFSLLKAEKIVIATVRCS